MVELMAVLSNPSTTDITVEIISSDVTAISMYAHYYNLFVNICMYHVLYHILHYITCILPYIHTSYTIHVHKCTIHISTYICAHIHVLSYGCRRTELRINWQKQTLMLACSQVDNALLLPMPANYTIN